MTLDEIEKKARDYAAACDMTGNHDCTAAELARALIAVLPVVRIAEGSTDFLALSNRAHRNGDPWRQKIADAVDVMRGELLKAESDWPKVGA